MCRATIRLGVWIPVSLLCISVVVAAGRDVRLVEAVKNQDKAAVQALLKERVDLNAPYDGATALHWAIHRDDAELAGLLIAGGANVNVANDQGVTPLSLACGTPNAALVVRLLAAGANPNAAQTTGETPVMTCARTGSVEAVSALLTKGAQVNAAELSRGQTALMWAVAERRPEVVKVLLARGADANSRTKVFQQTIYTGEPNSLAYRSELVETRDRGGSTALLFAARNGDLESAKLLIAAGAKVNDTGADGNTALVVASHSGYGNLAAFLLDKDANPNSAGAGYTALHAAILRADTTLVKALLAHGANPNAQVTKATPTTREGMDFILPATVLGATPFLLAAKFVDAASMRALADSGADPSAQIRDGSTALMLAAGIGWETGADRRAVPILRTLTAEDERLALNAVTVAASLGADVNAVNKAGDTALHGAASKGFNSVVQFLVSKGAALDVKNRRGQTPLSLTSAERLPGVPHGGPSLSATADLLRKLGAKDAR